MTHRSSPHPSAPWSVACALLAAACASPTISGKPARPQGQPTPHPVAAARTKEAAGAPVEAVPVESSTLDFESWDGGVPSGWSALGGIVESDEGLVRHGRRSVRLRNVDGKELVGIKNMREAGAFLGKRITVSGWVSCHGGAPKDVSILLGAAGEYGETIARAISEIGATEGSWSKLAATADIPADARTVVIAAFASSIGDCVVDDLSLDVAAIPERKTVTVSGHVLDAGGKPVAAMAVSAFHGEELAALTASAADGAFSFDLPDGVYSFAATGPAGFAASTADRITAAEVVLKTVAPGSLVRVDGTVEDPRTDRTSPVILATGNNDAAARCAVLPDAEGHFSAFLPEARHYWSIQSDRRLKVAHATNRGSRRAIDTGRLRSPTDAPASVLAWVKTRSLVVEDTSPDPATMPDLGVTLRGVRVVAIGEATHGSSEFFALKHKLVRYLVERHGFRTFALEASGHSCDAASAFVENGKGTADAALNALNLWPWRTMEMKDLFVWMRGWNEAHERPSDRLRVVCFDVQSSRSFEQLQEFLSCAEPAQASSLLEAIRELDPKLDAYGYEKDDSVRKRVWAGLTQLSARFARDRKRWTATCGAPATHAGEAAMRSLVQFHGARLDMAGIKRADDGWVQRDRSMAENILIEAREHPGEKIMVWTHNVHASLDAEGYESLGSRLREVLGAKVLLVGLAFEAGSFQAVDLQPDTVNGWLRRFEVAPLGAGSLASAFADIGQGFVALDLRKLATAPRQVREWFSAFHPMWETGSTYSSDAAMWQLTPITARFDLVVFAKRVTRAIPLH